MELCPEAARHLDPHPGHADFPLAGVVGEADVRVGHEGRHGPPVPPEAPVEAVRVGSRDPPAPSLRTRRDLRQLPAALGQDGPVTPAHAPASGLGQDPGVASAGPVAGPAQRPFHQARPAEAVGFHDGRQPAEEMGAEGPVRTPVVGEVTRPAVVDQRAGVAGDDADVPDRPASAPAVRELQGQGPVGGDVEPPPPAVDPESGPVGVEGGALQQVRDGGLLPRPGRGAQAADVSQAGGLGEHGAGDRLDHGDGPGRGQHARARQVDREGLEARAVPQRARHAVGEPPLCPGPAVRAFPGPGLHAAPADLGDDAGRDAPPASGGGDPREVGAAGVAGIDGDRLPDGGPAHVRAGPQVRFRAPAAVPSGTPGGPVPLRPRRRDAGVGVGPAGRPSRQDGHQDAGQREKGLDRRRGVRARPALPPDGIEPGPATVQPPARRGCVHRRHRSASTTMISASAVIRPDGWTVQRAAPLCQAQGWPTADGRG